MSDALHRVREAALELPRAELDHAAVVDRDGRLHVFGSLSLNVFETVS